MPLSFRMSNVLLLEQELFWPRDLASSESASITLANRDEKSKFNYILFSVQSLEQERHLLRRRLEEARDESEARALELQADVETLRSQLEEQNERARRAERDQAALVAELTAQNTRLADQLREAAKQEEQLLIEVKVLREKCALRNTTLQDHVSSLEILRDEVRT